MTVHTLHLSVKDELKGSGTPLQATPGRFGIRWHSWIMTAMKCGYKVEMKASESWRLQISEQNFQNEESLDVLRLLPSHKMTSSQSPIEITWRQRISQTALLCNCASLTCPWCLTITCHPVLAIQWSQITHSKTFLGRSLPLKSLKVWGVSNGERAKFTCHYGPCKVHFDMSSLAQFGFLLKQIVLTRLSSRVFFKQ